MMFTARWVAVLLSGWSLVGCAPHLASQPRMPGAGASVEERRGAYERYRLRESGDNWLGHHWTRGDGKYDLEGIEPLLDISAETRSRLAQAKTRAALVLPMSALGGAFLGLAVGNQLGGKKIFSSSTNTGLYIVGGSLSAASITIVIVWDPVSGIGDVYNAGLSEQLGLPSSAKSPATP